MSLPVRVHEAAEAEIKEAVDFYDVESPGLGDELTNEIERGIDDISRYPQLAPVVRGRSIRAKNLMKFPHVLVYHVGQSEIILLAVAHHKRRPFYWTSRV